MKETRRPLSAQAQSALKLLPSLATKTERHLGAVANLSPRLAAQVWAELKAHGKVIG